MCFICISLSLYVLSVSLSHLMFLSFSHFLLFFISLLFYIFIAALQYVTRLTRRILTASHTDICVNFSSLFSLSVSLSFSSLSLYQSFSEYSPPITFYVFSANRREHRRLRSLLTKVSKFINSLIIHLIGHKLLANQFVIYGEINYKLFVSRINIIKKMCFLRKKGGIKSLRWQSDSECRRWSLAIARLPIIRSSVENWKCD